MLIYQVNATSLTGLVFTVDGLSQQVKLNSIFISRIVTAMWVRQFSLDRGQGSIDEARRDCCESSRGNGSQKTLLLN